MQVEATSQREGEALCTGRSCRGRGGGRGSCCLMPLTLLRVEASQSGSTTAPETGLEEKAVLSSHPSSKVKPNFFLCYCARAVPQRTQSAIDGRLRHLTHCKAMDTPHFAASQKGWWSSGARTVMQSRGPDHDFSVLCTWNLFIQSNFILKTRSSVQPEKHGAPWL